eukprot:scaffold1137_cov392-Pavlova_lutheri.AAC.19
MLRHLVKDVILGLLCPNQSIASFWLQIVTSKRVAVLASAIFHVGREVQVLAFLLRWIGDTSIVSSLSTWRADPQHAKLSTPPSSLCAVRILYPSPYVRL